MGTLFAPKLGLSLPLFVLNFIIIKLNWELGGSQLNKGVIKYLA
jgi:hypothetical protein